ncbi:MAG: hypothetical protein K2L12_02390 [Clostridia bacterium]|nr:hypothetical protein [Clostridia bacterium]
MTFLNQNRGYADQQVGFEVEVSPIQLPQGDYKNKTELARIKKNGVKLITLVTDGGIGSNKPYIEFVSEPQKTQEGIKNFLNIINDILSSVKTSTKKLSQLLDVPALRGFEVEYSNGVTADLPLKVLPGVKVNPNSIHINLDVPFNKLKNFANSSLYENGTTDDKKSTSFKHAYILAEKIFHGYPDTIKSLFALFLYQNIVYIKNSIKKEPKREPRITNYKNYIEEVINDANGRVINDVAKEKFNVLFKVSKADIIHEVFSAEELGILLDMQYGELERTLKSIINLYGNGNDKYSAESLYQILINNANEKMDNSDICYYDEPRISGLIRPKKMEVQRVPSDYYIVAEIRNKTTYNEQLRKIFNKDYQPDFKTKRDIFIKDFCEFVKAFTK